MAITISEVEAVSRIGGVMRQVAGTREPIIVGRGGKTQVAIVPGEEKDEGKTRRTQLRDWLEEADRVVA